MKDKIVDHLFRHQFGKMVSILTRIFGLEHLETIEDAIQDTFIKAIKSWRTQMPDNPEAWLTAAAKNRVIDLMRSLKSEKERKQKYFSGPASMQISDLFLDDEIEDSQMRMIFTACHPILDPKEQIAFALKSIGGFNIKEIAKALLTKPETIKKRLQRARKKVAEHEISFEIPVAQEIPKRMDRVIEIIYLIFNEGFHSFDKSTEMRKALCGEALRLCKLISQRKTLANPKFYALFALLCFHSSRIESKFNNDDEMISLENQDRKKWYIPLMMLGDQVMNNALPENVTITSYHCEAAIASLHLSAKTFQETNWRQILKWYYTLDQLHSTPNSQLNIAIVQLQLEDISGAAEHLFSLEIQDLSHNEYLYYATLSDYYLKVKDFAKALAYIDKALNLTSHSAEQNRFNLKRDEILRDFSKE